MGADLYINTIYEQQRQRYEPGFDKWVKIRDQATTEEERERAQRRVNWYLDRLHERGYFRDPYNPADLLWQFQLSWWSDVLPLVNDKDDLGVATSGKLLTRLREREPVFEESLKSRDQRWQKYFRRRYEVLKAFLKEAIDRNEPIHCSL